jgi:methylated-DNA-[protein]-cysteine S-methyltransferase
LNRISEGHPFDAILPAPFGGLGVRLIGNLLSELVFLPSHPGGEAGGEGALLTIANGVPSPQPLCPTGCSPREGGRFIESLATELNAYFANAHHSLNLPTLLRDFPQGTPFRQRVWAALCEIPVGTVITYGELARQVGSAPRAVGQAVGDNPWPILIPCHRVVSATGLGGFNHHQDGFPLDVKRWLLRHEGVL